MYHKFMCMAVACILFSQVNLRSQTIQSNQADHLTHNTVAPLAEMGTFHFKLTQPKGGMQIFTLDQMETLRREIETMRLADDRVYWNYSEYITIVIYSKNEITSPGFVLSSELYQ